MPDRLHASTFAIAIVASLLVGFIASTLAYRWHLLHVPREGLTARMDHEMHLTGAQRQQIHHIMVDTRQRVMQIRHNFQRERRKALIGAYQQIRATLTPAQQVQFDRDFALPAMRGVPGTPEPDQNATAVPETAPSPP